MQRRADPLNDYDSSMIIDLGPLAQEPDMLRDRREEKTRVGRMPEKGLSLATILPRRGARAHGRPIVIARPMPKRRTWPTVLAFAVGAILLTASGFMVGRVLMRWVPAAHPSSRPAPKPGFPSRMPPPSAHIAPAPVTHAARAVPVARRPIPAGHAILHGRPPARVVIRTSAPARPEPVPAPAVDPEAADLLSAGQTFYHSGDFEQARDAFKQALRIDEAGGESRFWLAMAYAHEGKGWRSCHQFREYASHFPEGPRAGYVSARIADCGG
jgi:hypothetical protein